MLMDASRNPSWVRHAAAGGASELLTELHFDGEHAITEKTLKISNSNKA